MSKNIEKMKKELQIRKFENALMELEIKYAERLQDAERIKLQIDEQAEKINELKSQLDEMGE